MSSGWPLAVRAFAVRLRFIFAVAVAALLAMAWPSFRAAWERVFPAKPRGEQSVGLDSEFFCPMCPGVASDWPSKCPVCHMTLVRRPRGDAVVLLDGVVARMQLSPYRVQLAGVRTVAADYLPLEREILAAGKTSNREVEISLDPSDALLLQRSMRAEALADSLPSKPSVVGKVATLTPTKATIALPPETNWPNGLFVKVRLTRLLAELEPFKARTEPPPLRANAPRVVYRCPNHREQFRDQPGKCPLDGLELERRRLADNERLDWWCPMHPKRVCDHAGEKCADCNGMVLVPRITAFAPAGRVLAVPRSAVVQSGSRQIVYVETMPGMFDGRIVKLGAPVGDHAPVLEGIAAGERVVAAGAFLLDAESRLNPALAAAYFGSAGAGRTPAPPTSKTEPSSSALSPADRKLAAAQKTCPVTDAPLDSMGGPVKIEVSGRIVFLCCEGCEDEIRKETKKYLAKLPPAGP